MSPKIQAKSVVHNPSAEELKAMTGEMPTATLTNFGNYNVRTTVVSRSKNSTYVVTDDGSDMGGRFRGVQRISREEYERVAQIQDDYIADQDMVIVDGFIGSNPDFRTKARLVIERAHANIAGMQRQLYYEGGQVEHDEADTTVIYTPRLPMPGYPDDRLIAVDLENNVTRVFNSDYFGESKKGGLRMWNKIVHDRGGLPMHAGCKVIPTDDGDKTALIVGLSGTGKTTTTFTQQNGSLPVQDDFIALMPGGAVYTTEAGCFAKTHGLDPEFEPTIYGACTTPDAYLENAGMKDGVVDFFDDSYTQNGRATFEFSLIEHADPNALGAADFLLILNRNDNIIPAVARLRPEQAAAYFMLGETTGTSAGGASEAGKFLRVPGTNPFFPMAHDFQGNRLLELLESHPLDVYLLNTGRVGGGDGDERSKKVKIPHSSALVKGIAEGTITWEEDPDFGYEVATSVPGFPEEDGDLLRPRELYEAQGRVEEYEEWVARLKSERAEFFEKFPDLDDRITKAIE
ncbi:MAG TPA: phosphoenolpyruvate carboxykinase [Acidimicrobiia bacterium]|nr:phosphoenolpyruvate carboxykinase [Acidimicrobiia bacterium]